MKLTLPTATLCFLACFAFAEDPTKSPPDNTLTDAERRDGWVLLFDGKTQDGWMNSDQTAPRTPVENGTLNPHGAGHYMLVHKEQWGNFVFKADFKISPHCNSGIFVRTSPLTPRPGKDVGFNGLEIAIDDTTTAGFVDTGALYDLSKPTRNAMKPVGEWNHIEITCRDAVIVLARLRHLAELAIPAGAPHPIDRITDVHKIDVVRALRHPRHDGARRQVPLHARSREFRRLDRGEILFEPQALRL